MQPPDASSPGDLPPDTTRHGIRHLARIVLFVFLLTFILSRVVVFLIMARLLPDLYLHLGGTHVHHLNYGIFLLVGTGAWMLFHPPEHRRSQAWCAALYAIGLALTFDEFGMWLHLGGAYWQRASFDAVTVIAAAFALLAFAPAPRDWKRRHVVGAALAAIAIAVFGSLLMRSLERHDVPGRLHRLEERGPG